MKEHSAHSLEVFKKQTDYVLNFGEKKFSNCFWGHWAQFEMPNDRGSSSFLELFVWEHNGMFGILGRW